MKNVELVVVFALSIHVAFTNTISSIHNGASVEDAVEIDETPSVPSVDDEAVAFDISNLGSEIWESHRCVPTECNEDALENPIETVSKPLVSMDARTLADEVEAESRATSRCTASACAQLCRRLGFRYSRCSNGWCICWR